MARIAGSASVVGTIALKGGAALDRSLKELEPKLQRKVIRKAMRAGAKIILQAAKANAPVDTGQLRKSLKVRAMKRQRGRVGVTVGTADGDYKGDEFYGAFVEYGHRLGKRNNAQKQRIRLEKKGQRIADDRPIVPPKPFLRPAFDEKKEAAADAIVDALWAGILAEV